MIHWKMVREILFLALPAVGEMTLYMMIWILDTMMVGKYGGKLAVSSVGLSTEIIYSFFNILIAIGISSSLTSLISRALGAEDFKKAERIANAGFKLSFALAILFFVILFFVPKQILLLAGATEDFLIDFLFNEQRNVSRSERYEDFSLCCSPYQYCESFPGLCSNFWKIRFSGMGSTRSGDCNGCGKRCRFAFTMDKIEKTSLSSSPVFLF